MSKLKHKAVAEAERLDAALQGLPKSTPAPDKRPRNRSDYQRILDAQAKQINDQLKGGLKVCHVHFAGPTRLRVIAARVKNNELQCLPLYAARHPEDEGFWHTVPTGSRIDIS